MSQTFSHTVSIPVDPTVIFAALQDAATWQAIGGVSHVTDATHDADGLLTGYRFAAQVGGMDRPGKATVVDSVFPHSMTVAIASRELTGTIVVSIGPEPGGTEMTVSLTVRPNGLIASMAFPVIVAAIGSGLPHNVDQFAMRMAAG